MNGLLEAAYYQQSMLNLAFAPRGIVYAGAHTGEHIPLFLMVGFSNILAIEPNPRAFSQLSKHRSESVRCVLGALTDKRGTSTYYDIPGIPTLNSTLEPDLEYFSRAAGSTEKLRCDRCEVATFSLDHLLASTGPVYNALYMNIQGGELAALSGASARLDEVDLIITECNFRRRYKDCPSFDELDARLDGLGFILMQLRKYTWSGAEHGEAWYVRRRHVERHATLARSVAPATPPT